MKNIIILHLIAVICLDLFFFLPDYSKSMLLSLVLYLDLAFLVISIPLSLALSKKYYPQLLEIDNIFVFILNKYTKNQKIIFVLLHLVGFALFLYKPTFESFYTRVLQIDIFCGFIISLIALYGFSLYKVENHSK